MNMHPAVHPLVISGSALKRITKARVASHSVMLRVMGSHLFVGYRDESEFGQLSQDAQVGPHVQLAAHQHHLGTGAELLGLPLPLWRTTEPCINTQKCTGDRRGAGDCRHWESNTDTSGCGEFSLWIELCVQLPAARSFCVRFPMSARRPNPRPVP